MEGNTGSTLGRADDADTYSLGRIYGEIKARAPKAQVYVVGVPSIFPAASLARNSGVP